MVILLLFKYTKTTRLTCVHYSRFYSPMEGKTPKLSIVFEENVRVDA